MRVSYIQSEIRFSRTRPRDGELTLLPDSVCRCTSTDVIDDPSIEPLPFFDGESIPSLSSLSSVVWRATDSPYLLNDSSCPADNPPFISSPSVASPWADALTTAWPTAAAPFPSQSASPTPQRIPEASRISTETYSLGDCAVDTESLHRQGRHQQQTGQGNEERLTLKKSRHRKIDRTRRSREAAVLKRLRLLVRPSGAGDGEKRDKVSVLEQSAQAIAELQESLEKLRRDVGDQLAQQLREMDETVKTTSPLTTRGGSISSPYGSLFLSASLPMLLVCCDSGRVLDGNTVLFANLGCARHQLIGRHLDLGYFNQSTTSAHVLSPSDDGYRPLIQGGDGQLRPSRRLQQCEPSLHKLRDLCAGKVESIEAMWRSELEHGRAYELTMTSWTAQRVQVKDAMGRVVRTKPTYMIFACSSRDVVRLDSLENLDSWT